jgi:crossover junction endodeoxyribonuclease RuvC
LGIDPGTVTCGYGVVDYHATRFRAVTYGVVQCARSMTFPERLATIFAGLEKVIAECRPECAAIEEAFAGKSIQSALRIGEARGIAIVAAARAGIPVTQYSAKLVKKAVVGSGTAHKTQVQRTVQVILGLSEPPEPEDASDALAIAICHCHRQQGPQIRT